MPNGGFLISQVKQVQDRVFDALLRKNGIGEFNGAQGRILFILWQQDNLSIVEIANKTGLAKTTLTSMLDRMEQQGHIKRCFDENDRRKIRISLTEKARRLEKKYQNVSEEMNQIFYRGFTDEEIRILDQGLEKVLQNLKGEQLT